jgi:hypothetical protein
MENQFSQMIPLTEKSSQRSRTTVIIMVVASILAFMAFWNSRPESWQNERLNRYIQLRQFGYLSDSAKRAVEAKGEPQIIAQFHQLRSEFQNVSQYFGKPTYFESYFQIMQRNNLEHVLSVKVPFLGIYFDVNDLGMLGGFGLAMMTILLFLALSREYTNLVFVFRVIANDNDPHRQTMHYNQLSMTQVFNIPPTMEISNFVKGLTLVLYSLPLIVFGLIWLNDLKTISDGFSISWSNTIISTICSTIFLMLILYFTFNNIKNYVKIDRLWAKNRPAPLAS